MNDDDDESMLNLEKISRLIPEVIAIANMASLSIIKIYNDFDSADETLIKHKSDHSPLTLADLASNQAIIDGLSRLTPEIPIISEEVEASFRLGAAHKIFWLIDPLDGTKEFIARNGEFTVNISLIQDGYPVFGVVQSPLQGKVYWGGKNLGAFRKSENTTQEIFVAADIQGNERPYRIVVSRSHMNDMTARIIKNLHAYEIMSAGSSLKLCLVAEGSADLYPRLGPTCEWDTAAAQAVVEGAGGFVYNLVGERIRYGKSDILNPYFIAASAPFQAYDLNTDDTH